MYNVINEQTYHDCMILFGKSRLYTVPLRYLVQDWNSPYFWKSTSNFEFTYHYLVGW